MEIVNLEKLKKFVLVERRCEIEINQNLQKIIEIDKIKAKKLEYAKISSKSF